MFTWRRSLVAAIVVLGGLTLALWLAPSGQYLLLPDEAQPVDPLVAVEGEGADGNQADGTQAAPGGGGIFMVDILVRKANLLERLFPRINEGADLIAEERINPQGVSEQQRRQSNRLDMTRSQEIAAAVALQHLDYDVNVQSSGAEISLVAAGLAGRPGRPAAGRRDPRGRGSAGEITRRASRCIRGRPAGRPGDGRRAALGRAEGLHADHPGIRGGPRKSRDRRRRAAGGLDQPADRHRHQTPARSEAHRRASHSRSTSSTSWAATSTRAVGSSSRASLRSTARSSLSAGSSRR